MTATTVKERIAEIYTAEDWCPEGIDIVTRAPDTVAAHYAFDEIPPAGFLNVVLMCNPPKGRAMYLQSLQELVDDMPECESKTRLAVQSAGNATEMMLAEHSDWRAGLDRFDECCNLTGQSSLWLVSGRHDDSWNMIHNLIRARAQVDSIPADAAGVALLALWRSRCTVEEWGGGLA